MISQTLDEAAIFDVARQIESADARRRYIEGACAGDPALQARLEALLLIDQADRGFLERPAQGVTTRADYEITEGPGAQIGPYTLVEAIGEGGFGKVFVAEQDQPVHRMVALKIIKPGMDTHQVVGRFEAERRALARRRGTTRPSSSGRRNGQRRGPTPCSSFSRARCSRPPGRRVRRAG